MSFFTIAEVKRAAFNATNTSLNESFSGQHANAADTFFEAKARVSGISATTRFDIFLSHAYADRLIVAGLYTLLTGDGFTVYVDWIHDRSRLDRTRVTAGNADILRNRMRQCRSLLYATTENHSASKWMPWECGYFDGYDSKVVGTAVQAGHVAILPVVESTYSTFTGQEYLALYPTARKGAHFTRNLNIHNQTNPVSSLKFDQWIANGHP